MFILVAGDVKYRFASYYMDHMVLQKAPQKAVIWGFANETADTSVPINLCLYRSNDVDRQHFSGHFSNSGTMI